MSKLLLYKYVFVLGNSVFNDININCFLSKFMNVGMIYQNSVTF